jgi:iron complex outermembrane receptor protein
MSRYRRLALYATAATIACAASPAALAQSVKEDGASAANSLEEIVVTARRKEERAQSVPIAITAFTPVDIEKRHVQQISDLANNVPSLVVHQAASDANGAASSSIRLRGLAGTVVYFADVPIGTTDYSSSAEIYPRGTGPGFYYDLENVEVLKGPQGTLFGQNSIGGLISITPHKPTNDFDGYFKATFGNYSDREFEGSVNLPIVADKLMVRVAGASQQRDGYTKDLATGQDLNNRNYFAWRVGVTLRPSDDIENYFLYDGYWQDSNGSPNFPIYVNPHFTFSQISLPNIGGDPKHPTFNVPLTLGTGTALSSLTNPNTSTATFFSLLNAYHAGQNPTLAFFPNIAQIIVEQQKLGPRAVLGQANQGIGKDYLYGFTNTTTWDINDALTLKNIAAARIFKQLSTGDLFGAPIPFIYLGAQSDPKEWNDNTAQYSEEIQLQGKSLADKLSWVLGGFLEFTHPIGDNLSSISPLGSTTYDHIYNTTRSQAAFIHGIYDLSDYVEGLRFTAGYRYTWDFSSVGERSTAGVDAITRNAAGIATNCAGFVNDNNCFTGSLANFSAYGWNLGLDYQVTPTTLVYVRSSNAYRPGTTNPNVPVEYQSLKPEHVTDVELGIKSDWELDGIHFRTNSDIYHTDYKSIQVNQFVQVKNGQGQVGIQTLETNAASAYLEGWEFEGSVIPVSGLEISPHISYLYTHYDKYPPVLGGGEGYAPPFNFAPKWQYGIFTTYHLPLDASIGDVALTANYSWTGHQYDDGAIGEIYPITHSYDNLDIRIDWTDAFQYPVDLAFFMTNALDKTYIVGVTPVYTQLGFTSVNYSEPRMFGFSAKYRFGGPEQGQTQETQAYTPPPAVAPRPSAPASYLVFFDFNKSDLTVQAAQIVDQAASNAGPAKVTRLTVTGHTDTVGSDAYNMRLSRRRAESVAARLEKDGIPSGEIEIVAKGKHDLLVPTADGVREPQNRRVQIVYSGAAAS